MIRVCVTISVHVNLHAYLNEAFVSVRRICKHTSCIARAYGICRPDDSKQHKVHKEALHRLRVCGVHT